jgi:Zn-dependent protease with chaperone function
VSHADPIQDETSNCESTEQEHVSNAAKGAVLTADEGVPATHVAGRRGLRGLYDRLLAWKLPGLPPELGVIQWIFSASLRMPMATTAALAAAWTGVIVALWVGAFIGIGSIIVTAFGVAVSGHAAGALAFTSNTSGGLIFLSAFVAGAVGFGTGFAATYASSLLGGISLVAAALFVGIVVGFIIALVWLCMEQRVLQWRGYREPSRREWDQYLTNPLQTVIDNMGLHAVPLLLIMDTPIPQAWTYTRTIVLSKGMLEGLDAGELTGVLAHEMMHWRQGDGLALRMVAYFAWPVAICYSVGMFLSGRSGASESGASATPHSSGQSTTKGAVNFLTFFAWMLLWPAWLLTKFVVVPMTAGESRKIEYQADAGAAEAGLGGGLQRALERISAFEIPKNAWDAALMSTHPPTELRIESLEVGGIKRAEPPGAIVEVSAKRVGQMFGVLAVLVVAAVSPHIPVWHHNHNDWWW